MTTVIYNLLVNDFKNLFVVFYLRNKIFASQTNYIYSTICYRTIKSLKGASILVKIICSDFCVNQARIQQCRIIVIFLPYFGYWPRTFLFCWGNIHNTVTFSSAESTGNDIPIQTLRSQHIKLSLMLSQNKNQSHPLR